MVSTGGFVEMTGKLDKSGAQAARKARLAKALRDNLGRRKEQARGRAGEGGRQPADGEAAPSNRHKDER